jgi:hypothetical protein
VLLGSHSFSRSCRLASTLPPQSTEEFERLPISALFWLLSAALFPLQRSIV